MNHTLERHKFFPVIAWSLVLGFAFFTYHLSRNLSEAAVHLSTQTEVTVTQLERGR